MPTATLPAGRYLFAVRAVRTTYGGRTNAVLTRSRLFQAAGTRSSIITFDAFDGYAEQIDTLRKDGRLVDGVELLNVFEYYRTRDWPTGDVPGDPLPALAGYSAEPEFYADGTPWRITYRAGNDTLHDYQRADGSVYLRAPTNLVNRGDKGRTGIYRVDRQGRVLGQYADAEAWFKAWILELNDDPDLPTFLMLEDFFLSHLLSPFESSQVHEILFVHVPHTNGPRRWDTSLNKKAAAAFNRLSHVDAVVLLTERQQRDVQARYGPRNHIFTIPNPIELPDLPAQPVERDPLHFLAIARLDPGKRVEQTIDAFAAVHANLPAARLDIAGDGPERARLEQHIEDAGLTGAVTLLGHDPQARERLWSASALIMTTEYEAFPLVLLEAISRACPVVSYDIKYGPREILGDDECGFVVADGDLNAMAERMLRLAGDPDLIAELGAAGRRATARYSADNVLTLWAQVLNRAVEMKSERVAIRRYGLTVGRLGISDGPQPDRWGHALESSDPHLIVDATLVAGLSGPDGFGKDLVISLESVAIDSGDRTALPREVERQGLDEYRIWARVPLRTLCPDPRAVTDFRFRISFTCRNVGWAHYLVQQNKDAPVQELSYDKHGRLTLRAGKFSS